jgi:hypothetical protein
MAANARTNIQVDEFFIVFPFGVPAGASENGKGKQSRIVPRKLAI